jgi:hypothetical protein
MCYLQRSWLSEGKDQFSRSISDQVKYVFDSDKYRIASYTGQYNTDAEWVEENLDKKNFNHIIYKTGVYPPIPEVGNFERSIDYVPLNKFNSKITNSIPYNEYYNYGKAK